jgi:hypothetical protein
MENYEEKIERLESLLEVHNSGKDINGSCYIIDTTGDKRVYFTLYKFIPFAMAKNPFMYVKNLSTDFEKAVKTMMSETSLPILVCNTNNNNLVVRNFRNRIKECVVYISFGKYKGKTMSEIWDIDRNWVMWFSKNYKTSPYTTDWRGVQVKTKWSQVDKILHEQAKELISLFWQEKIEENKKSCTSEYFGNLKERAEVEIVIEKIVKNDNYCIINGNIGGNLVYLYDKDFNLNVGDVVKIKATPTKHIEKLGKKTTYLNRVTLI